MLLAEAYLDANAKLYVSGPMTGYPLFNFPAFESAARQLRDMGFAVVSPAEKDIEAGFDPTGRDDDFDLRAALEWDVQAVLESDAVVLLPGWEDSPGCAIEVLTAAAAGIPVVPIDRVTAVRRTA